MTPELRYLVYSTILGLLHLIAASHFISFQYGYRWTASNREEEKPPLKGIVGRVDRAGINFLETFPFFAALVIAAHLVNRDSSLTLWAARLYFGDVSSMQWPTVPVSQLCDPQSGTSPAEASFCLLSLY